MGVRSRGVVIAASLALLFPSLLAPRVARAQEPAPVVDTDLTTTTLAPPSTPPPLDIPYVQYGVAFTAEFVANAGSICSVRADPNAPCILGSGGGIVARVGRRSAGPWYFGAAYELSKQDPGSLYRFATLQQLRFEARWYLTTGLDTQPYATFGGGAVAYGNEWSIDTYGPMAFLGVGIESQLSRRTVVGFALAYRVLGFQRYTDSSNFERDAGISQIVGIDLSLEERDPLGGRH